MNLILAFFIVLFACNVFAKTDRSQAAKTEFKRTNPCPINGNTRGSCPGYEIDHIIALCAGGADTPDNMQWLTVTSHRRKTKEDVKTCRAMI